MIKKVTEHDFIKAFSEIRPDNFSRAGLVALFKYFKDLEEDICEQLELDVIAICCEFTQYNSIEELAEAYPGAVEVNDNYDIDEVETINNLQQCTTVLTAIDGSFVVMNF
jgi:hypothetical protein